MSINSTIGQVAASNPLVGTVLSTAGTDAALLSSLGSVGSATGPFDGVLGAAELAPLQAADSPGSASSALTPSSPFASVLAADNPSAAGALDQVNAQGAIDGQLLAATGLGQNVNTFA